MPLIIATLQLRQLLPRSHYSLRCIFLICLRRAAVMRFFITMMLFTGIC